MPRGTGIQISVNVMNLDRSWTDESVKTSRMGIVHGSNPSLQRCFDVPIGLGIQSWDNLCSLAFYIHDQ